MVAGRDVEEPEVEIGQDLGGQVIGVRMHRVVVLTHGWAPLRRWSDVSGRDGGLALRSPGNGTSVGDGSVPQVREEGNELRPSARAPALDRSARYAQQLGRLLDGVTLDVDEDKAARWSSGRVRSALSISHASSRRPNGSLGSIGWALSCSGRGTVGRALARRRRSRHALTTIRCNQVVTWASPRKVAAERCALSSASWRASAASSGSPVVRRATAQSRSRCRPTSVVNAVGSPAACAASSSASGRWSSTVTGEAYSPAGAPCGCRAARSPAGPRKGPRPRRRRRDIRPRRRAGR